MTVDGNRAIIVLDADPLPETGGRAVVDDSAAHRHGDRGTHDVGDVDTRVEGSPAHAGTGGEGAFSGLDRRGRAGSALVLGRSALYWMALSSCSSMLATGLNSEIARICGAACVPLEARISSPSSSA